MSWVARLRRQDTASVARAVARPPAPPTAVYPALPRAQPVGVGESAPVTSDEERIYVAPPWKLIWWKFRKHKLAMVAAWVTLAFYLVALLAEFLAPYLPDTTNARYTYAPPTKIHFVDKEGQFHPRPFVYGYKVTVDPVALRRTFTPDETKRYDIYFFVQSPKYKLWNRFEMDRHLFGLKEKDGIIFLFGADRLGRDAFSRMVYGARISLSIGLIGVFLSFVLGIFFGGLSGYYGGVLDDVIQRVIEFLRSIPTIPLWMALAAALPRTWSPVHIYFGITVVLSLIGWTGLARVVRGRFLAMREEDFVMAARLAGSSEWRVIFRHMVPSFASHIIAALTLAIPGVILAETALSYLGLGLRPPVVSWGVLLQEAQNIRSVAQAPWLLLPGVAVVIAVLMMNFLGDGLRDAADPYAR